MTAVSTLRKRGSHRSISPDEITAAAAYQEPDEPHPVCEHVTSSSSEYAFLFYEQSTDLLEEVQVLPKEDISAAAPGINEARGVAEGMDGSPLPVLPLPRRGVERARL